MNGAHEVGGTLINYAYIQAIAPWSVLVKGNVIVKKSMHQIFAVMISGRGKYSQNYLCFTNDLLVYIYIFFFLTENESTGEIPQKLLAIQAAGSPSVLLIRLSCLNH